MNLLKKMFLDRVNSQVKVELKNTKFVEELNKYEQRLSNYPFN